MTKLCWNESCQLQEQFPFDAKKTRWYDADIVTQMGDKKHRQKDIDDLQTIKVNKILLLKDLFPLNIEISKYRNPVNGIPPILQHDKKFRPKYSILSKVRWKSRKKRAKSPFKNIEKRSLKLVLYPSNCLRCQIHKALTNTVLKLLLFTI